MDMTRFSGPGDAGYVRVRDQLWLWVDAVAQRSVEDRADRNNTNTRVHQEQPKQMLLQYSGTVYSGGGPVFQGSQTAGRDLHFDFGSRRR